MVKNKKGGSGHKRMARKHVSGGGGYQNKIRKKQEEGEIYARVIKLNGGQFAHIKCHDGKTRNLVIRGQFRRRKRGNRLATDTLVLAGLRDWEVINGKKLEKADLLEVYGTHEADQLQKSGELPECLYTEIQKEEEADGLVFDKNATTNDFISENTVVAQDTTVSSANESNKDKDKDMFDGDFDWDDI
jgi:translation initiation factor IF-1